jgi:hypothetical protein
VGNQAPELLLFTDFVPLSQQQNQWTAIPEAHARNQALGLLLPNWLVPPCLQCYCTTLLERMPEKQVPKLLLSKGLVSLNLQQLPWVWVVHTSKRASGLRLPENLVHPHLQQLL